jgi:hypothetical protein
MLYIVLLKECSRVKLISDFEDSCRKVSGFAINREEKQNRTL